MKIIHTSDLHLGQVIYRHYDRDDEHDHFFDQLATCCLEENPDALIVTGDIFDIQQPSAAVWRRFTEHFINLRHALPDMPIVLIAGNHDSPSRLHSHKPVWAEVGIEIIALPPAPGESGTAEAWMEDFIIELESGYIVVVPYMTSQRERCLAELLAEVERRNTNRKPVIMTGHLAVTGCDITGHDMEIGKIRTVELGELGSGYDYLALGHIHRPQTLGDKSGEETGSDDDGRYFESLRYASPVVRYSGSALHVSCDERYPHTISIVTIDRHEGDVEVRTRRINQLRHFHILPLKDEAPFTSADEALVRLRKFASDGGEGYFRFRMSRNIALPSDFNQQVYEIIDPLDGRLRYNPKIDWTGRDAAGESLAEIPVFEVADLQQMTNPLDFIEKTADRYPGIELESLREAFIEIERELREMDEPTVTKNSKNKS